MPTSSPLRARRPLRVTGAAAAALLALGALSACSADGSADPAAGDGASGPSGTITVFAAASLKESFEKLGAEFERQHPGTEVVLNFGGSDSLAAGITGGAPADVFAAASTRTMKTVTDAGATATAPVTFARNRLEIATLPGNPDGITSLKDLTGPGLKVVLCDRTVPCGAAAQKALDAAGLELTPVSYEQDVKSALTKVTLKEADAAIVYRTDVRAAGDKVRGVDFPEAAGAVNDYPIALLENSRNTGTAKAFIALVRSTEGRRTLAETGFQSP
ncbi:MULTISPECIES: molybdate ABC transporter substrate-binding protein [unclassified Streptomyces]|uniref:molybdate ABC transporter substrate-binding protein n=1 Tax=unclassified Streptomyces TaxID=2593676 RepID=UPI003D765274